MPTINSIAACARKHRATGTKHCQTLSKKLKNAAYGEVDNARVALALISNQELVLAVIIGLEADSALKARGTQ